MYVTINSAAAFMDEFTSAGRGDQFSYTALESLFKYYDQLEDYELDVIGVCCEWAEYAGEEDVLEYYGMEDFDELQDKYTIIRLYHGAILVRD